MLNYIFSSRYRYKEKSVIEDLFLEKTLKLKNESLYLKPESIIKDKNSVFFLYSDEYIKKYSTSPHHKKIYKVYKNIPLFLLETLKQSKNFPPEAFEKKTAFISPFPFYTFQLAHEFSLYLLLKNNIVFTFKNEKQLKKQVFNFFSLKNIKNIFKIIDEKSVYLLFFIEENNDKNFEKHIFSMQNANVFIFSNKLTHLIRLKKVELPQISIYDLLNNSLCDEASDLEVLEYTFPNPYFYEYEKSLEPENFSHIKKKKIKKNYGFFDKKSGVSWFIFPHKILFSNKKEAISGIREYPELFLSGIRYLSLKEKEETFNSLPLRYKLNFFSKLPVKTENMLLSLISSLSRENKHTTAKTILKEHLHLGEKSILKFIELLYTSGEYREAYKYLSKIDKIPALLKVKVLRKSGHIDEALKLIKEREKLSSELLIEKALLYYIKGEFKKSEKILLSLLKKQINLKCKIDSLRYLSYIKREKGDYTSGLELIVKAYNLSSNTGDWILMGDISSEIGQLYFKTEDFNGALKWFKLASYYYTKKSSKRGLMLSKFNIAETLKEMGELTEAENLIKEVLEYDETGGNTISLAIDYSTYGEILFFKGDFKKAKEYLKKALSIKEAQSIIEADYIKFILCLIERCSNYEFKTPVFKKILISKEKEKSVKISKKELKDLKTSMQIKIFTALNLLKDKGLLKEVSPIPEKLKKELKLKYKGFLNFNNQEIKKNYEIIGREGSLSHIFKILDKVKNLPFSILIEGESGTGKEVVARYIHETSKRKNAPFIPINCASLPENLLESILFGFKKGAFTGAYEDRDGVIKNAERGTVFLDEIGEMPLSLQAKLLRVLQEKEVFPIGSAKPQKINVRFIFATNKDLMALSQKKEFREDLFYRINEISVKLLPIRERKEEIIDFFNYFLKKYSKELKRSKPEISPEVENILTLYKWPGNVREIEAEVKRVLIRLDENENLITSEHISENIIKQTYIANPKNIKNNEITFISRRKIVEKDAVISALRKANLNKKKAAEILGISRVYLYKLIKKHNINEIFI